MEITLNPTASYDAKHTRLAINIICIALVAISILSLFPTFATNIDGNNDLMWWVTKSNAMKGRNDLAEKWLIWIVIIIQFIVTTCGFLTLAVKVSMFSITAAFLSAPSFWLKVHNAKLQMKQQGQQGQQGEKNYVLIVFSFLIPDLAGWSEYGDQLNADGSIGQNGLLTLGDYVKEHGWLTVFTLFLAGLLFSGKLFELAGKVTNGLNVIADRAVSVDYEGKFGSLLESEKQYQFVFDETQIIGKNRKKLADRLYSQMKGAVNDNTSSAFYNQLGVNIEKAVNEILKESPTHLLANKNLTYVNALNQSLSFSVTWNTTTDMATAFSNAEITASGGKIVKKNGVWMIKMSALLEDTKNTNAETSMKQVELANNGVIYLTFTANQLFSSEQPANGTK